MVKAIGPLSQSLDLVVNARQSGSVVLCSARNGDKRGGDFKKTPTGIALAAGHPDFQTAKIVYRGNRLA